MENTSSDQTKENNTAQNKGDFNGARYMKDAHLLDRNKKFSPSFGGVKSAITGDICDPIHRDIGHVMPFLMKESLQACCQLIYKEDSEAIDLLDTIGQVFAKIWNESLNNNLIGLSLFNQLYEEVSSNERGSEIYGAFCSFFVQSYFCYIFTVERLTIGIRPLSSEDAEFNAMETVLSALSEDTRKLAFKEWQDSGIWPTNINGSSLLRRLDDFIQVVKEGQKLRKEYLEEKLKKESGSKEVVSDA